MTGSAAIATGQGRFVAIDAMRGVAAISIVAYHYASPVLHATGSVSSAYIAVDLFFMLSGFVIALSYERKLIRSMSVGTFLWRRMVRLYPLALLGMLVAGGALTEGALANHFDHSRLMALMRDALKGLAFLPRVHGDDFAFPTNPPMWSLLFEVAINVVYALVVTMLTTRRLLIICGLAAIGIVVAAYGHGNLDMGATTHTFAGGIFRTLWGFSIGVVLYRSWASGRLDRVANTAPVLLAAAYLLCCAAPYHTGYSWALSAATVLLAFPLLVALAIRSAPTAVVATWCEELGLLSYPMYVLHWGLMFWALIIAGVGNELPALAVGFVLVFPLSWLAARYWDEPARAMLGRLAPPSLRAPHA